MTGYQELVTDPSYAEQILCFTAPMVGNYGVADEPLGVEAGARRGGGDAGGARAGLDGLAVRARHRALTGIDTRSLVLHLRDRGAMRAAIVGGDAPTSTRRCAPCASSRRWTGARSSRGSR